LTKEQLNEYKHYKAEIERCDKKMLRLKENTPRVEYGKVYGSSPSFPFCERGFTVSGAGETDGKEWTRKVREVYLETKANREKCAELKIEIEMMIERIDNIRDRKIMDEYIIQGKTQQEVARAIPVDQSVVSRTIEKYIK